MVRFNASWVTSYGPRPVDRMTDRQTQLKTLSSLNFVPERFLFKGLILSDSFTLMTHYFPNTLQEFFYHLRFRFPRLFA